MHRLRLTCRKVDQIPLFKGISKRNYGRTSIKCSNFVSITHTRSPIPSPASQFPTPPEIIASNKLITSYIRRGDLDSALEVFRSMKTRTTVTWNSILAGFSCKPGKLKDAQDLFEKIPEPDIVSYNVMLSCYFKNGDVEAAKGFFDTIRVRDIATWNTMISGFSRNGRMDDAQEVFDVMPERNAVTWNAMVSGYVNAGNMESALCLFAKAPAKDVLAWTSLLTGFMRCGKVECAEKIFYELEGKNLVTWNAMIAGYVENGRGEDGLNLFKKMMEIGIQGNPSSLSSVLLGCSSLSMLKLGKQLHQHTYKLPIYRDTIVKTSLISMYCKCGGLEDGWKLFIDTSCKDVVTWNAMISGYAYHGFSEKALALFDKMINKGIEPDWITFIGVLSACNHAGLVDLGIRYFDTMQKDYGVRLKPDHYTCVVDLLGRAGRLAEAVDLIMKMPFEPHSAIYGTLLGACKIHKNVEMAEFAAMKLLNLDPSNPAAYVQLANVYAVNKKWECVSKIRKAMRENGAIKTPGCSWIEIKNAVHEFRSGDHVHPDLGIIHEKLNELEERMKLAGYVPVLESSFHDVTKEQKVELLLWHSEKLAIAYGLMKVSSPLPIMVFKNLRVCEDCHLAIKFISATECRAIIVRDTMRFHHFYNGECSCRDYW